VNGVVRDGTISGGVRDITSSRALKDLVMTMFTPCPGGSVAGSLNLINHFVNAVESALCRLPLEAVLGEGSLQDIFTASALSAVANATCGFAASHIGELSHPGGSSAGGIAPPIAVLLHGAVGAGMSAIQGRDILSGAVGAMVGEVSGMIYNRVCMADMGADHPGRAEAIQRGTDVARLTGIAVSGIFDLDPAAASCAAANAAGNNGLLRVPAVVTRAVADLTDSPTLHEAADTLEAADQALDRFDEFSNAVDDAVMDMAVTSWNQGIDNAQEHLPQVQSVAQQALAVCPGPYGLLCRAALPVGGAVVKGGLNMLRLPETRTEAAIEAALFVGTAGVGKGLRAAYPYVEPFVLPYAKRAGTYISREVAAMTSAVEKTSVFKYFGKKQGSVPSSTPRLPATPNMSHAASSTSESLVKSETRASSKRGKSAADARRQKLTEAGFQEHHIGSHTNKRVKDHPFVEMAGVDLQGRSNKIFLPTLEGAKKSTTTRTIHQGRHDQKVSERIGQQLDRAEKLAVAQNWSREECREALRLIFQAERKHLISGERILNKHARSGAKDPDLEVCFDSILKARKKE